MVVEMARYMLKSKEMPQNFREKRSKVLGEGILKEIGKDQSWSALLLFSHSRVKELHNFNIYRVIH